MTAITQRLLHLRPILRPHPYYHHHFSSTSDPEPKSEISEPKSEPESQPQSRSSFSSIFNDVKASLQREPPQQNLFQSLGKAVSSSDGTSPQTLPPPKFTNLEEVQRNLTKFRSPSAASPSSSGTGQFISLQELYQKNVIAKADNDTAASPNFPTAKRPSYDTVRESLRQLRANSPKIQTEKDPMSLSRFNETLKLKPDLSADTEPSLSFFGKEKNASKDAPTAEMRTKLLRMYNYSDLGEKLKTLRPEKKKGKWFSLHELNERLAKLRLIEEKATEKARMGGGIFFQDLRETLASLDDKAKKKTKQRLGILSNLGATPSFMFSPPNDELVEKYFHPDNMSSAEKLKLELQKVRDEFKMSESDCGSARVQVAQLTTKIKHLSTVLQKKDKHSRKGLQAMVQRRKKLLKYLRRTDWDSYCLVLSKLGLRDNPDTKA